MNSLKALAFGRIAAGAGAFAVPTLTGQLAGIGGTPDSHLAARMFGGRDLALGVATLAFDGEQLRGILRAGVLVDVLDVAAGVMGIRQKSSTTAQAAPLVLAAAGAIAIGVSELRKG